MRILSSQVLVELYIGASEQNIPEVPRSLRGSMNLPFKSGMSSWNMNSTQRLTQKWRAGEIISLQYQNGVFV